jgi:hypothetical protein
VQATASLYDVHTTRSNSLSNPWNYMAIVTHELTHIPTDRQTTWVRCILYPVLYLAFFNRVFKLQTALESFPGYAACGSEEVSEKVSETSPPIDTPRFKRLYVFRRDRQWRLQP